MIKRNTYRFDCNLLFNTNTYSIQNDNGKLKHSTLISQTNRLKIFLIFNKEKETIYVIQMTHTKKTTTLRLVQNLNKFLFQFAWGENVSYTITFYLE